MSVCGDTVEWDKLGSALGVADSDLEKIRECTGEDKDKCKQELFKVGKLAGCSLKEKCLYPFHLPLSGTCESWNAGSRNGTRNVQFSAIMNLIRGVVWA